MSGPRRATLVAVVALLVALVAPSAAALQVTVTIDSEPTTPVAPGGTADVGFSVTMASADNENILCAQNGQVTVDITAEGVDTALGLGGSVDPTTMTFTIPQNVYTGQTGAWESDAQSGTFTVEIGDALPSDHMSHMYTVKAAYDGTAPGGCQGDFGADEGTASFSMPLDPPNGADPNATGTPDPDDDDKESPAPGFAFVLVAVAIGAVALRRR